MRRRRLSALTFLVAFAALVSLGGVLFEVTPERGRTVKLVYGVRF